ncbi:MAG: hypothetical protein IME98_04040, partial [Proteobacteria bacterium]|nr:hypothetical protein [Pseudomonadota bacterium]
MHAQKRLFYALCLVLFSVTILPSLSYAADGFIEGALGARTQDDTTKSDSFNLVDLRFQVKGSYTPEVKEEWSPEVNFKGELLLDGYNEHLLLLLREANLSFTPTDIIDVKLGRQTLTWGTGDLVFVNDLFPKDYISFFSGRDDEYLKRPSDALKFSIFAELASFDIVLSPIMEANNSITGSRFSFYDGLSGATIGEAANRDFIEPEETVENMELALRAYRTFGSFEGALYFFNGFYNEPRGILNAGLEQFFYPRLRVYGASLRGPVLGGIGNIEAGYYDSREDPDGDKGNIENPAVKYLVGYTKDLGGDFSIGAQYLIEEMLEYSAYELNLGADEMQRDEFRHLIT